MLFLFPSYLHGEQSHTFSAQLQECENCTGRGVRLVDGLSVLIQTLQEDERLYSQNDSLADTAAL